MKDSPESTSSAQGKGKSPLSMRRAFLLWLRRELRDVARTMIIFIPCWLFFTTFFYELRSIPSESMTPGLQVGDRVAVSKFAYGYSLWSLPLGLGGLFAEDSSAGERWFGKLPERGDIAVFRHPNDDKVMIKRVIGLPGDRIRVQNGRLYINDKLTDRQLERDFLYIPYRGGIARKARQFREFFDGSPHSIHEFGDNYPYDQTPLFIVPDQHLFMMGDNRDNSEDSRAPSGHPELAGKALRRNSGRGIGFVPLDHLIGRAGTVLFTFHRCRRDSQRECPARRVWKPL